ncbi:GNAT family N-acetyltransferase [Planktotalea sp.]|uniref:GNAT family N-acetyltransferase n=1 Tax=Planktotalea sp. TaxID=2029877 RepID=UPI00329988C6
MKLDTSVSLADELLDLRPMKSEDFAALYRAASDPLIWAGHPAKNRFEEDVFRGYFDGLLEAGGTYVVRLKETQCVIGCSRYYIAEDAPADVAIGFTFLTRDQWGGETNFHLKTLMFEHAFQVHERVWLHIAPDNIRSQKAAERLDAQHMPNVEITLLGQKSKNFAYVFDKQNWANLKAART